jgi:hypothetical protein
MQKLKRYAAYVLGFGLAGACIIAGIVGLANGSPVHSWLPLPIFGLALLAAMILLVRWNKAGDVNSFDLEGQDGAIIAGIVVAGFAAAFIVGKVT